MAYRQSHRLSAKVEFSPEAEQLYLEAKNKSEFIRQAIEHYVHNVVAFKSDIQEIKQLLIELKEKGIAVPVALPGQQAAVQDPEATEDHPAAEKQLTDEERELQAGIHHTLGSFLAFGGGEDE